MGKAMTVGSPMVPLFRKPPCANQEISRISKSLKTNKDTAKDRKIERLQTHTAYPARVCTLHFHMSHQTRCNSARSSASLRSALPAKRHRVAGLKCPTGSRDLGVRSLQQPSSPHDKWWLHPPAPEGRLNTLQQSASTRHPRYPRGRTSIATTNSHSCEGSAPRTSTRAIGPASL